MAGLTIRASKLGIVSHRTHGNITELASRRSEFDREGVGYVPSCEGSDLYVSVLQ
jgi:hypothetical protein